MEVMMYAVFILICLFIGFLTVKFFKVIAALAMILVATFVLGFLIMPFDVSLGGKVVGFSAGLFICGYLIHGLALLFSAVFVTPFALLWAAIKTLFS
jgi:hypothetical protein